MNTILITGANRGLGFELTREYLLAEWKVIACCRDPQQAHELRELNNKNLMIEALEVSNFSQINTLAEKLKNESIDILFNNAGVFTPLEQNTLETVEPDEWLEMFKINCIAPLVMARSFLPHVIKSSRRIIANMSSGMGSIEQGGGGFYDYRSTKAALNSATRTLAADLESKGVTVVVFDPGWVQTDMGGPHATLTPSQSISGIKRKLDSLTIIDSGNFYNYKGLKVYW